MAGTFWTTKGKAFYYVRDFSKCVTLHLKGHEYSKVVIEVDDKQATAERLRKNAAGMIYLLHVNCRLEWPCRFCLCLRVVS